MIESGISYAWNQVNYDSPKTVLWDVSKSCFWLGKNEDWKEDWVFAKKGSFVSSFSWCVFETFVSGHEFRELLKIFIFCLLERILIFCIFIPKTTEIGAFCLPCFQSVDFLSRRV